MIVELVKQDRKPTDLIDRNVLENAIMFDLAAAVWICWCRRRNSGSGGRAGCSRR